MVKQLLCKIFLTASLLGQQEEIWLFCQDFYSFGKKDSYESLKQMQLSQLRQLKSSNIPPILTLQGKSNPEYISLVPVGSYKGIGEFFALNEALKEQMGEEVWQKQQAALKSTLNFQVFSAHRFLPECSHVPQMGNVNLRNRPYVHYFVYSVEPDQETMFEELLQRKSCDHAKQKSDACWRVWKVALGADVPKFILAIFAISEEELGKAVSKADIVDPEIEKILRRERDGKAILRADLSYFPNVAISTK